MLLDYDRSCDGQPLAGAFPDLLGREEGIENAVEILLWNPATIVLNDDFDAFLNSSGANPDQSGACIAAGGLDGVRRVDNEIEKNLVELVDVADDCGQFPQLCVDA